MSRESNGRAILLGTAALAGVAVWLRWRPFRVAIKGESMRPELLPDDFLVAVTAGSRAIRRGTLVVVEHPHRPGFEMVKRVDGLSGDARGAGILGPGECWVVGDDPAASTDSRSFGPVRLEAVHGVVVARYWPPGRFRVWATRG